MLILYKGILSPLRDLILDQSRRDEQVFYFLRCEDEQPFSQPTYAQFLS